MSGYLEGEDAFDRIVDKLIEAERRHATEAALWQEGSAAKRTAETDLSNANRELLRLKAEIAANHPKLKELWAAGDAVRKALGSNTITHDHQVRLVQALTAACRACGGDDDDMPF